MKKNGFAMIQAIFMVFISSLVASFFIKMFRTYKIEVNKVNAQRKLNLIKKWIESLSTGRNINYAKEEIKKITHIIHEDREMVLGILKSDLFHDISSKEIFVVINKKGSGPVVAPLFYIKQQPLKGYYIMITTDNKMKNAKENNIITPSNSSNYIECSGLKDIELISSNK